MLIFNCSVSFKLFDFDNDGYIDKTELLEMLKIALENSAIHLAEKDMKFVVDNTFNEVDVNGDGKISYEEYKSMVTKRPSFVDYLTVKVLPDKEEIDLLQKVKSSPPTV